MKLRILGAVLYLQSLTLSPQVVTHTQPSYNELISQIELHEGTPKVWPYLKSYLAKAKHEKNWPHAVLAYKEMLHESREALQITYADSMVMAAKKTGDNDLIGSSYLSKGIAYYQRRELHRALDNYLVANKFLAASEDEYLKHKVKYSLALIKFYLGYYHEAIALLDECRAYYKDLHSVAYLKSLHSLILCYAFTDDHRRAAATADFALKESARLKVKTLLPYIDAASGVNAYKAKQYQRAVKAITYALPVIREDRDFPNEATANFYLGSAYWKLGSHDKAITHFLEVDRLFTEKNYIRPDLRKSYEYLIKYYHYRNERDLELRYINRLLEIDGILAQEFRSLVEKVHKEYDTAELLEEKDKIQSALRWSRWSVWIFMGLAALLALVIIILVRRQRAQRRLNRKRFEDLIHNRSAEPVKAAPPAEKVLSINPAVVESILAKLDDFEKRKGYLKKDLTATRLAEQFGTNSKYLSHVIHSHRDKSFVNYINDLRVDYLVGRLHEEPKLRKYTNAALANEAGFSTTQHFTTASKKKAEISPRYFVEAFEKYQAKE